MAKKTTKRHNGGMPDSRKSDQDAIMLPEVEKSNVWSVDSMFVERGERTNVSL